MRLSNAQTYEYYLQAKTRPAICNHRYCWGTGTLRRRPVAPFTNMV